MKHLLSKKRIAFLLGFTMVCMLAGCGGRTSKVVHCDRCGVEINVSGDSKVDEDWTVYCDDCEKELGLDKIGQE